MECLLSDPSVVDYNTWDLERLRELAFQAQGRTAWNTVEQLHFVLESLLEFLYFYQAYKRKEDSRARKLQ